MSKIELKIKKLSELAKIPAYQTEESAGFDLNSIEEVELAPMQRVLVATGISFEIPKGYEIQIRPRSGLAFKQGITVLNSPGTIDSDYRGEIKVLLINLSDKKVKLDIGERVAQAILKEVCQANFVEVKELNDTQRGEKGFGSTGRK